MAQTVMKLNFPGRIDNDSDDEGTQEGKRANEGVRKYLWNQLDASRAALSQAKLELDRQNGQVKDLLDQLKGDCPPSASDSLNINRAILQRKQERENAEKAKIKVEQVEEYPPCLTDSHAYVAWRISNGSLKNIKDIKICPRVCDGAVPSVYKLRGAKGDCLSSNDNAWVLIEILKGKLVLKAAQSEDVVIEVFMTCTLNGQRVVVQGDKVKLRLNDLVKPKEESWSSISSLLFSSESVAVQVTGGGLDVLRKAHFLVPIGSYFGITDVYAPDLNKFPFLSNSVMKISERSGDELVDIQMYGTRAQILAILRLFKDAIGNKLLHRVRNEKKHTYSDLKASLLEELDLILEGANDATRVSDVCPAIAEDSTSMQELFRVKKTVLAADKKSGIRVPSEKYYDPQGPWQRAKKAELRTDKIMNSLSK